MDTDPGYARWLIGLTKKVISIYTFWVIVLFLRWFMNRKTTVQFLFCWFNFWESGSNLPARGHRAMSQFGHCNPRILPDDWLAWQKKVISIYSFWVIILLLRWFMNCKTTVQFLTCWLNFWESGSNLLGRGQTNKSVWSLTPRICRWTILLIDNR